MMQAWADYLHGLQVNQEWRTGVDTVAAPKRAESFNDSAYDPKQQARFRR